MNKNTSFVRDYMTKDPICIKADSDILQAIYQLLSHEISGAPVVDNDCKCLGILTERDCIQVAVTAGYFNDLGGKVLNYMSSSVETASPDDNLLDIAERFIISSYRRFPVLENGELVGLISRKDVLVAITALQ